MQQNPGLRQQTPQQLIQQQQQMPRQPGPLSGLVSQVQTHGQIPKHIMQQLMQTLKNPPSQEQQAELLTILKANPPVMAAFIKQRVCR